ncbi:flavin reductase family protein [Kibdelosporangium aridum]|uniref:Flavin reductase family protein n=1 Tax=Kibdelosporangium aridum TaxID=2030 RepID=A0A428ZTX0_KIBAR|nr:flavin reductase family protein [Kibdelosporangium aridum]RSM91461.1 flavin reductase family protein [Kibdelosporangium aridum]
MSSAPSDFNELLGELDYPMLVVTAAGNGRQAGCLVGFASQCSIEPPRFMVWLSKKNYTYVVARETDVLGVHVLSTQNTELATLFGTLTGFTADKFSQCRWRTGPEGVPVLSDCPQWFVGEVLQRFDTGDHEGLLLQPAVVAKSPGAGQTGFQRVKSLKPGNEA